MISQLKTSTLRLRIKSSLMRSLMLLLTEGSIHLVSTQNFPKNSISYPLIRILGERNVSFSENFVYVLNG